MTLNAARTRLPLLAGALLSLNAGADVIDTSAQEPWEGCAYCHGIDGISNSPRFPHLAGQPQDYLRKQLRDFRDGLRTNDGGVMQTQAGELETDTIRALAEYFSQQTPPAPAASAQSQEARRLYYTGKPEQGLPACADCHDSGEQTVPVLAGQHPEYLTRQLSDFAAGRRENAPAGTMGVIAHKLSEQQRQKLAAYIAGLEGGSR